MIIDCHTHIWQSPEQLGDGALAELSRPTIVAGQRMRLLPQADMPERDCFLVYAEELKNVARIQAFRDFLVAKAQRWRY